MAISVQCGECGARYNVNESMAGKRAKCKKCGATMSIPAPADDLAGDDDLSALAELAPPPPKPPGIEHTFRNDGDVAVRFVNVHAPAGFDLRLESD